MRLIILGPPGSGKGVQSKRIAKHFDIVQISTGDTLRQAVSAGSELGRQAEHYMKKGLLVPDDLMVRLIMNRLSTEDCQRGFILDGFPRTIAQAEMLDDLLQKENAILDAVLELKVSDQVVLQRLTNRRLCPQCGADYNLITKPPQVDEVCDRCGARLIQRQDDRRETIVHRLEVYHRQTEPLVAYYREKGNLLTFDAEQSVEEVSHTMVETLESRTGS
jgi:adenylate kinase